VPSHCGKLASPHGGTVDVVVVVLVVVVVVTGAAGFALNRPG